MTDKERKYIEDYINTYRVYPPEYTGKRDFKTLVLLNRSHKFDKRFNTITRLEGKINDSGDFEIVGLFRFPVGEPNKKEKTDGIKLDLVIRGYNEMVERLGYADRVIDPINNENHKHWNLRDLVCEVERIRADYYDQSGELYKMKTEDPKRFTRETATIHYYIRTYRPYINDLKCYEKHNCKYDN